MKQESHIRATTSAPHSPQIYIESPISKFLSRNLRLPSSKSKKQNSSSLSYMEKLFSFFPGKPSFRTAPATPIREGVATPTREHDVPFQERAPRISNKNTDALNPGSINATQLGHNDLSMKCPGPDNTAIKLNCGRQKSKTRTYQQHRKSNSYENASVVSDYFQHPKENDNSQSSGFGLGSLLLKLATAMHFSEEDPLKTLDCATRAVKFIEKSPGGSLSLDLVMSLHIVAATRCRLGQWEEAASVLQQAISVPLCEENLDHVLSAFSSHMQLGDVLTMLGQESTALLSYQKAYELQTKALGEMDPQVGETCSYLAEAHLQALQLDKAAEYCGQALAIHAKHKRHKSQGSVEEAMDRQLMALILCENEEYKQALEHLVIANVALMENHREEEVVVIDARIGDMYMALGRYDEAQFSYQRALSFFKSKYGEFHMKVASIFVCLANQCVKIGKYREAHLHCEKALRIYSRETEGTIKEDLATGLVEVASVFESMTQREQALILLERALDMLEGLPGHHCVVLGIQGQMGILYYLLGRHKESLTVFQEGVSKLNAVGEGRSVLAGIFLNQMGLACLGLHNFQLSADYFEESKGILEEIWGTQHTYTLAAVSNLAGVYDALGRTGEAIVLLENVVEVKEEMLGTLHPDVVEEKQRLLQLLSHSGRERTKKTNTLEELLLLSNDNVNRTPLAQMRRNASSHIY